MPTICMLVCLAFALLPGRQKWLVSPRQGKIQVSGFTLLFETYTTALIQEERPMNAVARQVKETAPHLWRMFNHWVEKKKGELKLSGVRSIGVDETSRRKGYK